MKKQANEAKVKDKLILLIILSLAAGFFLLQPYKNTANNKVEQSVGKTIDKKDTLQFDCNNPHTEISRIIDEQDIKLAPEICLYQGCSGFTY